KKIVLLLLILVVVGMIYFLVNKEVLSKQSNQTVSVIEIPAIDLPKKSMKFSMKKAKSGELIFTGTFSKKETPLRLLNGLSKDKLNHEIHINPAFEYSEERVLILEKLVKTLVEEYSEGEIEYKGEKLLISGLVESQEVYEKIESWLSLSTINSFNNTKLVSSVNSKDIISQLQMVIEEEERDESKEHPPTEDEIETILSDLKVLADRAEVDKKKIQLKANPKRDIKKKVTSTNVEKPRKAIVKKEPLKKRVLIDSKKVAIVKVEPKQVQSQQNPKEENLKVEQKQEPVGLTDAQRYQLALQKQMPNEDIISLPSVNTVDMNIEDKIEQGKISPLRTNKPLVKEETVYIAPKEVAKIDNAIPFANLHETSTKLDGIISNEVVASPNP
ncbi:MAG: hypothetical protein K0U38_00420, partial [Epsilonproteobacteria bacterium]|nr:hypothetical protein [Campylobacterota bacterium]